MQHVRRVGFLVVSRRLLILYQVGAPVVCFLVHSDTACMIDFMPRVMGGGARKQCKDTLSDVDEVIRQRRRKPLMLEESERMAKEADDLERAKKALDLYNESKNSNAEELELVEAFNSNPFMARFIVYHMNFTARPKNGGDVEVKRYFAEIKIMDKHTLSKFCPVEPKGKHHQICVAG
ncbi:hypothetical protein Dimus_036484 [Dionaea muscipula]